MLQKDVYRSYIIILLILLGSCKAKTPATQLDKIIESYPYIENVPVQIDSVPRKIVLPAEKISISLTVKDTVIQAKRGIFELHNKGDSLNINYAPKDTIINEKKYVKVISVPQRSEPKTAKKLALILIVFFALWWRYKGKW